VKGIERLMSFLTGHSRVQPADAQAARVDDTLRELRRVSLELQNTNRALSLRVESRKEEPSSERSDT
jgi:hypothetical protein